MAPGLALAQDSSGCSLSLVFVGDIMGHDTQVAAAYNKNTQTYDFAESFSLVKTFILQADLAFANLETPLAGPPYTSYPVFSAPDQLVVGAKDAGFDVLFTANNHSCDKWRKGIERTVRVLDSLGIAHTGVFADSARWLSGYPLLVEKNGFRLSLLNYTYGTNGVRIPKGAIVNLTDTVQMRKDIAKAKQMEPDAIIAFMHWGDEYAQVPNNEQIKLTHFLVEEGVKIVVGAHPHVLQRMEFYPDKGYLVAYSLGNFVSGQRTKPRDGAALLHVSLLKKDGKTVIDSASYLLTYVHYPKISNLRRFMVVPVIKASLIDDRQAPGNMGWGRMAEYAKDARILMGTNMNVPEIMSIE
ncbi:MAG: CapA family protein [Breznakibacter sp.]